MTHSALDASAVLDRWGIRTLSPSSLTCWADDRATWVLRYGLKTKEPASPAMVRGNAVEAGFKALLYGHPLEEARTIAVNLFAMEMAEKGVDPSSEDAVAEAAIIEPMVDQCAAALLAKPLPTPVANQLRCDAWFDYDRFSIPVGGYADFVFDGWTLDLKTTKACPSKPKPMHIAQAACYAKARKEENAALLYVTPKKFAFYDLGSEEIDGAWRVLKPQARSLIRALDRAESLSDLCLDFPPPIDAWAWDDERRARAVSIVPEWA